jgi:hypothetical protein
MNCFFTVEQPVKIAKKHATARNVFIAPPESVTKFKICGDIVFSSISIKMQVQVQL